jgi:chromosome segregation ATPase
MAELDRLESAISRLTDISIDLKAMIAAHESRLNQSEKDTGVIFKLLEDRRKETDTKVDEIYTHMNDKDDKILLELKAHREASAKEHEALSKRINSIEKYIWIAIGGAAVISAIMPYVIKIMFNH